MWRDEFTTSVFEFLWSTYFFSRCWHDDAQEWRTCENDTGAIIMELHGTGIRCIHNPRDQAYIRYLICLRVRGTEACRGRLQALHGNWLTIGTRYPRLLLCRGSMGWA